jgi:hypothetical protein
MGGVMGGGGVQKVGDTLQDISLHVRTRYKIRHRIRNLSHYKCSQAFPRGPFSSIFCQKKSGICNLHHQETHGQQGSISNILSCERFSQAVSYDHKCRKLRAISEKNFYGTVTV